jgi:hypothetical protein
MDENLDPINPEEDSNNPSAPSPSFDDAFAQAEQALANVPQGDYITLRSASGNPVTVPVYEGEALTLQAVLDRSGLSFGASITAYVDGGAISRDAIVPSGAVVTLVGSVKGGSK